MKNMQMNRQGSSIFSESGSTAILALVLAMAVLFGITPLSLAQTASTGALTGTVTDRTGSNVAGATIRVTNEASGETVKLTTTENGNYRVAYLVPGKYRLEISKDGFKVLTFERLTVHVTETEEVNARLELGVISEKIVVEATPTVLETQSVALGYVTNEKMVESLPLVTRNYTQIITLSPGVSSEVNDAAGLGLGASSIAAGSTGASVAGGTTNSNNYQMDGLEVNDAFGSQVTGGVPVPNPDTIQEFKVQTGQYEASYGRSSGADVDVVTKTGGNQFHGVVFEFLRNDALNANTYFRNSVGKQRPVLKQNQFGFTLGGPIIKDKLHFFISYQGTRQRNGVDSNCAGNFQSPPLTNDRSRAGLGALFHPSFPAVAADGSNINSVALAVLQAKFPDGSFVVPSPQTVNSSLPFASQGFASFSQPCVFNEDHYMVNLDYDQSTKSRLIGRSYISDSGTTKTLPVTNFTGMPGLPGFPLVNPLRFRVFSLTHTYTFSTKLINQAVLGYHRAVSKTISSTPLASLPGFPSPVPFTWKNLGATIAPEFDKQGPAGIVTPNGVGIGGFGITEPFTENYYDFEDSLSYLHGRHTLQFGGGLSRLQSSFPFLGFQPTALATQDWGAFLQGITRRTVALQGFTGRSLRAWNFDGFGQDSFQVSSRLTVTLGLRYEYQGLLGDDLGRASNIDIRLVNPHPTTDTLVGYVVASNFPGTLPAGVTRAANTAALDGTGQHTFGPRVGFSWKLPRTNRFVIRGGYGIYYGRTTGQPFFQLVASPPFSTFIRARGSSLSQPFGTPFSGLPFFPPFNATSFQSLAPSTFEPTFRPPIEQSYSLNLQTELAHNLVLEVGWVGSKGTHLVEQHLFNQAGSASPSNPINGQTSNTFANIQLRAPFQGFFVDGSGSESTEGIHNYNGLLVSLNKRFSNGLQFLAAYTYARDLTDLGNGFGGFQSFNGGPTIGDQNNRSARIGRNDFVRPQRFIISYIYELPGPHGHSYLANKILKGWGVSGVTTIQSGQPLGFIELNSLNAFGIGQGGDPDRPQLASGCTGIVTPGPVGSKLNNYFNSSCFTTPPVIGADGIATAFGNSGSGIVLGPDQRNFDLAIIKRTPLWGENKSLEFRAEFFNAFNTTNFANPNFIVGFVSCNVDPSVSGTPCNKVVGAPTQPQIVLIPNSGFGQITDTTVNPRIIQFGLKLFF